MTLKRELDEQVRNSSAKFPDSARKTLEKFRNDLKNSGIEDMIPVEGTFFPSFDLQDQDGKQVSSEDLLEEGPIVAVFFRGKW